MATIEDVRPYYYDPNNNNYLPLWDIAGLAIICNVDPELKLKE